MSTAPQVDIDVDDFWADPYPALAAMRATAPIAFVPQLGATLLTRRDDIHRCEKNVAVFSSDQPGGLMNVLMGQNMMRKDGEAHRAERSVYTPAISTRAIAATWADQFSRLADAALDRLDRSATVDLVVDYATVVSGEALKAMTGLTNITHADMDAWSQAMIDGIANYTGDPAIESRCHAATAAIDAAIDDRLPELERHPDHSLLAVMLESGMPLDDVRANIKLTISGGQNEPRDAIAGATWALLSHPEQLARVRDGEVRWLDVFEEYCRWISPIGMSPRRVATSHTYGDVDFDVDERVFLMFSSANRDEQHFADADAFDVGRNTRAAMAFGAGPHFCAGAAASRSLVGDVALPKLFERFPQMSLAVSAAPATFGGWAFRGPLNLPVRLG